MKAYQIEEFGLDGLVQNEVETPEPGPEEVLVDLEAVSINYRDLMMIQGNYNPDQPLPLIPFSDGCGEVVETGGEVESWSRGDRVAPIFAQDWLEGDLSASKRSSTLGGPLPGTLAEYQTFPAHGLVEVPDHLTPQQAATLPCAGVTAWNGLTWGDGLKPGETVLLQGTGGVSSFGLQLAQSMGARVILTSSSDTKRERMEDLGADVTINYQTNPDWHEAVLEATDGDGVDRVLEVGGADTLEQTLTCVGFEGHVSLIGVLSGVQGELSVTSALMNRLNLRGTLVGSRADFREFNQALDHHEITPMVDETFPFDEALEAIEHLQAGNHMGKVVINCSD